MGGQRSTLRSTGATHDGQRERQRECVCCRSSWSADGRTAADERQVPRWIRENRQTDRDCERARETDRQTERRERQRDTDSQTETRETERHRERERREREQTDRAVS